MNFVRTTAFRTFYGRLRNCKNSINAPIATGRARYGCAQSRPIFVSLRNASTAYPASPAMTSDEKDPLGFVRSSRWPSVRAWFLREHPQCELCGGIEKLTVHHVKPFHQFPDLELHPQNLFTLCEENGCHLIWGHLGCYRSINANVVRDVRAFAKKIRNRP